MTTITSKQLIDLAANTLLKAEERIAQLEQQLINQSKTISGHQEKALNLAKEIEQLRDPDWKTYIELTEQWLTHYPADIFDGSSGDKGPLFVVAVRKALQNLEGMK